MRNGSNPVTSRPLNSTRPRGRAVLPGQAAEQRAFARPVRPDQAPQLALRDAHVHPVDGQHAAEPHRQRLGGEQRRHSAGASSTAARPGQQARQQAFGRRLHAPRHAQHRRQQNAAEQHVGVQPLDRPRPARQYLQRHARRHRPHERPHAAHQHPDHHLPGIAQREHRRADEHAIGEQHPRQPRHRAADGEHPQPDAPARRSPAAPPAARSRESPSPPARTASAAST